MLLVAVRLLWSSLMTEEARVVLIELVPPLEPPPERRPEQRPVERPDHRPVELQEPRPWRLQECVRTTDASFVSG